MARFCVFILFLTTSWILPAEASVRLMENVDKYTLGLSADILEDRDGMLTLDQVASEAFQGKWEKSRQKIINFAFSPSVFWIRVSLSSDLGHPKTYFLEYGGALQDYIDYYHVQNGKIIQEIHTGDRLPFRSRNFFFRNFLFPLEISPRETHEIYLRLSTHDGIHEPFPIILWDQELFSLSKGFRNFGMGLYFGTMLAMGIYNFFIFLSVRDRAYAYYVTYIIGLVSWLATYFGLTFQFFWPDAPDWGNQMIILSTCFWAFFMILFVQSLLETKRQVPWFYRLNQIAMICLCFTLFAGITDHYALGIKLLVAIGITMSSATIVAGIICFNNGFKSARYFLLAWTTLLVSLVVFGLKIAGILPAVLVVEKSVQIGSAIEVILLSLSLADRINELKKEKLIAQAQALEAVESSLKLKNDFITAISHELRTPMNAIIGGLEVIKTHPMEHLSSPLNVVQGGAADMMNLIDDILIHTEIQSGRLSIHSDTIDIRAHLKAMHEIYCHLCRDRHLTLDWRMESHLPTWIRTDQEKWFIILTKLLDNALKFTKEGGIYVYFDYAEKESRHLLIVTVRDTGVGIPTEKQPCIFDSFIQSDAGFQRRYGGLGIGLTICKQLTEALGGEIRFTSEIDKGSIFTVCLPFETETAPPVRPITAKVSPDDPILIVEDNLANQKVMAKLLDKIGYSSLTASHGREALEILSRTPVSLILMDLQMPVMDGFTCTEKIRSFNAVRIKDIPIIAVTANLMDADKKRCLDCGMNDYLKKPIDLTALKQCLSQFFG